MHLMRPTESVLTHAPPTNALLQFGPFELRPASARLLKDGRPLDVQPKVLDLIAHLAANPGLLMTREQLLDALWPDVFVSDDALFQTLRKARRALDDDARSPRWIETVHGRGYRFIGKVQTRERTSEASGSSSGFFGREDALAALDAAWEDGARVQVLLGPGGMGKTRLALEHLERSRPRWDEVVRIDATHAPSTDALFVELGSALSVPMNPQRGEPALTRLGRALARRGAALILVDNLEHLLPDAEAGLGALREAAPDVRWLITTRVRPTLSGAAITHLGPLDRKDGRELFVTRAARAGVVIEPRWYDTVDALVDDLDGMPLAIELAAVRSTLLDPAALRARLTRYLDLLSDPGQPGRGLRAAIAASWERLTPAEAATLSQCALFGGTFTVSQAEAVTRAPEPAPPVLDVLTALERHSLLEAPTAQARPTAGRLRLSASVRAFALERLTDGDAARRRLIDALLALEDVASALWERRDARFAEQLTAEAENLRGAITEAERLGDPGGAARLALVYAGLLAHAGRVSELEGLAARWADHPGLSVPIRVHMALYRERAGFQAARDDGMSRLDPLQALADAHRDEAPELPALVALARCDISAMTGRHDAAVEAGLRAAHEGWTTGTMLRGWRYAAVARLRQGRHAEAEALAVEGLSRCPVEGYDHARVDLRDTRAWALANQGRYPEAIALSQQNLETATACGMLLERLSVLCNLGSFLQEVGRFEEALARQTEAVEMVLRLEGAHRFYATQLSNRGLTLLHLDDLAAAEADLLTARAVLGEEHTMLGLFSKMNLAAHDALARRYTLCVQHSRAALATLETTPPMVRVAASLWLLVGLSALGEQDAARAALGEADAAERAGVPAFLAASLAQVRALVDGTAVPTPTSDAHPLVLLVRRAITRIPSASR